MAILIKSIISGLAFIFIYAELRYWERKQDFKSFHPKMNPAQYVSRKALYPEAIVLGIGLIIGLMISEYFF